MFQKIAKHRANDASNDVHRPPLMMSGGAPIEIGAEQALSQLGGAGDLHIFT